MAEQSSSLLEKAKDAVSAVSTKVVEYKDYLVSDEQKIIASEFKEKGVEKAQKAVEEITNSMDLIAKSGYQFKSISITLGLPPDITTSFHYSKDISENEKEAILQEARDRKFITIILKCLFKAGDFSHSIKIKEYHLEDVNVILGLMPGVTLNFNRNLT